MTRWIRTAPLTDAQIARITPHAQRRAVGRGDVLVRAGDTAVPFFIVVRGAIDAVRLTPDIDSAMPLPRTRCFR